MTYEEYTTERKRLFNLIEKMDRNGKRRSGDRVAEEIDALDLKWQETATLADLPEPNQEVFTAAGKMIEILQTVKDKAKESKSALLEFWEIYRLYEDLDQGLRRYQEALKEKV